MDLILIRVLVFYRYDYCRADIYIGKLETKN
jgi:hypothetical protein